MRGIRSRWDRARSDPYYDLDGFAARRERAEQDRRQEGWRLIVGLSGVLLALMLVGLLQVDVRDLAQGYGRPVVIAALGADLLACLLVFGAVTRSRLLRL